MRFSYPQYLPAGYAILLVTKCLLASQSKRLRNGISPLYRFSPSAVEGLVYTRYAAVIASALEAGRITARTTIPRHLKQKAFLFSFF